MKPLIFIILFIGFLMPACRQKSDPDHQNGSATKTTAKYQCPMHPQIVSDKPGTCPICKMDLVLIEQTELPSGKTDGSGKSATPAGQAAVHITESRQQMIGVRTTVVEVRPLFHKIQASAKVAYDTELYSAILEYREAVRAQAEIKDSPWPDVRKQSKSLVESSKRRLQIMGLSDKQIKELAYSNEDPTQLLLAEPGKNVWIYAQVYEQEAGLVKPGQMMEVTSSAFPNQVYKGRVLSVDRVLNPETRSIRVRAEVPNPEGRLKPEMFVDAVIHVDLAKALAVPNEAVLNTGTRQLVFVETEPGHFEPREIRTGHEASGWVEISSGVIAGERVVTSANFLIDSESKLKAVLKDSQHQH